MIELSFTKAQALVEELIGEFGDGFVYEQINSGCVYTHEGEPSCLVGQVMARAGLDPMDLETLLKSSCREGDYFYTINTFLASEGIFEADEEAEEFLGALQKYQDEGASWGEALRWVRDGHRYPWGVVYGQEV